MIVLQTNGYDTLCARQFGPASIKLVARRRLDVKSRERPGLRVLPSVDFVIEFSPFFATNAITGVFEQELQDCGKEEDDAISPAFVVVFVKDGGVAVIFEAKVELLLGS